jgi:hypothetical protein
MTQSVQGRRLPWGSLVTIAALGVVVVLMFGGDLGSRAPSADEKAWLADAFYGRLYVLGQWRDVHWQEEGARSRRPLVKYLIAASLAVTGQEIAAPDGGDRPAGPEAWSRARWVSVGAAVTAAAAVFVVARGLRHYVWGLVAVLLLTQHPVFRESAQTAGPALPAEALVLAVFAATLGVWHLAFRPEFAGRCWVALAAVMAVGTGLAWAAQARAGWAAALLAGLGGLSAALLGAGLRRRKPPVVPAAGNGPAAAAVGLLAPVGGLLLCRLLDPALAGEGVWLAPLLPPVLMGGAAYPLNGFAARDLPRWGWPVDWLVLPLVGWALWRTVRRGWAQWAARRPPLAWLMTLYAVLTGAGVLLFPAAPPEAALLPLAVTAMLLVVFLTADLIRSTFDNLRLPPPEEREGTG